MKLNQLEIYKIYSLERIFEGEQIISSAFQGHTLLSPLDKDFGSGLGIATPQTIGGTPRALRTQKLPLMTSMANRQRPRYLEATLQQAPFSHGNDLPIADDKVIE
jgi:hypothetical protein